METITAKCPQCGTQYQLTQEQLSVADGKVRCGACMTVFQAAQVPPVAQPVPTAKPSDDDDFMIHDGIDDHKHDDFNLDHNFNDLDNMADDFGHIDIPDSDPGAFDADEEWAEKLLEDLEDEVDEPEVHNPFLDGAPKQTPAPTKREFTPKEQKAKPLGADLDELDELDDLLELTQEEEDELSALAGTQGGDKEHMLDRIKPEPLEFKMAGHRAWLKTGGFIAASLLLVATLVAQLMYFDFDRLARQPQWRGIYQTACGIIGCTLPDQYSLQSISANHLSVKSHPYLNGILLVDSLLTNHADIDQPFPSLELFFTDKNDKIIAARRFEPQEYLRGELAEAQLMPSRHPIHIALEIVDPGKAADGYSMRLNYDKIQQP